MTRRSRAEAGLRGAALVQEGVSNNGTFQIVSITICAPSLATEDPTLELTSLHETYEQQLELWLLRLTNLKYLFNM